MGPKCEIHAQPKTWPDWLGYYWIVQRLAKTNPEAMKQVARHEMAWPMLKSSYKEFSAGEEKILRTLEVGHDAAEEFTNYGGVALGNRFAPLAESLWQFMSNLRNRLVRPTIHRWND